ncbi:MAG: hypothetical protein M1826_002066 [Phylliscum demangeonii]|nr:MAG: hypothetical protein M1826_002066 [Phylliscum demangeonii]
MATPPIRRIHVSDMRLAVHSAHARAAAGAGARRLTDRIPGFRALSTFLVALAINLRLAVDDDYGNDDDDDMEVTPTAGLPADIPPLTTYVVESSDDKVEALRLIADSVAQQRQLASRILIFHPSLLSGYILLVALVSHFLFRTAGDLPLLVTTIAGLTMAALLSIRWAVHGYLLMAEEMTFAWLRPRPSPVAADRRGGGHHDDAEDTILATRFGEQIVGALVIRLLSDGDGDGDGGGDDAHGRGPKASKKRKGAPSRTAVFRAWTVRLRYRHKGVGGHLLEEGVRLARERLGADARIRWASDHVHSRRILPVFFNTPFDRREQLAQKMLDDVLRTPE